MLHRDKDKSERELLIVAEHGVGRISKTGLVMFLIGCGSTLLFLTWVNKHRLMSSAIFQPIQLCGCKAEAKLNQSSAIHLGSCHRLLSFGFPFGFIKGFKLMLGMLLMCVCVNCVCVQRLPLQRCEIRPRSERN